MEDRAYGVNSRNIVNVQQLISIIILQVKKLSIYTYTMNNPANKKVFFDNFYK